MAIVNTLGISTADDLAEMIDDIGSTFTFKGVAISVTAGAWSKVRSIDPDESVNEYTVTIAAAQADFATLPNVVEGETGDLDGTTAYVDSIDTGELGEVVLLTLMRKDDG